MMRKRRLLLVLLLSLSGWFACNPGDGGNKPHALSDKPDFGSITDDTRDPSGTGGATGDGDGDTGSGGFPSATGGASADTGGSSSMGGEGGMGGMGGFGGEFGKMSW